MSAKFFKKTSGSSDGPLIEFPVVVVQDAKVKTKILPTRPHRDKKEVEKLFFLSVQKLQPLIISVSGKGYVI